MADTEEVPRLAGVKVPLNGGGHMFAANLPRGYAPIRPVEKVPELGYGHSYGNSFHLYRAPEGTTEVVFEYPRQGDVLHYVPVASETLSKLVKLPEKATLEEAREITEAIGTDWYDLFTAVRAPDKTERLMFNLDELKAAPSASAVDGVLPALPKESTWNEYADYTVFGPLWNGHVPGYLSNTAEAIARAVDQQIGRRRGLNIWTHKAQKERALDGSREVEAQGTVDGTDVSFSSSVPFHYKLPNVIKGQSMADARKKFDKQVAKYVALLSRPLTATIVEGDA